MDQQGSRQDIVYLECHGREHFRLKVNRTKPERVSVDADNGTWILSRYGDRTYKFCDFVDGIGVYNIADEVQLQKMVERASHERASASHIPDEYDE